MPISCDLLKLYADHFLPMFQFADTEHIFPISVESWLQHCADGDWNTPVDPHRGTAAIKGRSPVQVNTLTAERGCQGVTSGGPVGAPLDPTQPLPFGAFPATPDDESFLDFAGWSSLQTNDGLTAGDDSYVRAYFSPFFANFNSALAQAGPPPPTRTKPNLPTTVVVYCEGAWAGDFTRLSIQRQCFDFASPTTNDPNNLTPDPALDPFFVLTYYLFYPCTEPPPSPSSSAAASPNRFFREGQWEAVSMYFQSSGGAVSSANDLTLAADPSTVVPDFLVFSNGIVNSGDGRSPQMASSYPATVGSWTTGGHSVKDGPFYTAVSQFRQVFVTSGTHKNLFSPTPTSTTTTPDPGWSATGAAFEGVGGAIAGIGGIESANPIVIAVGLILILIGFLMQLFGTDSTTTELPDSSGDTASANGPSSHSAPPGGYPPPGFVAASLVYISMLPSPGTCSPPAWWSYPGRWGIAMTSGMSSWDSGGRRVDFNGRSRAYWNTVWLQSAQAFPG